MKLDQQQILSFLMGKEKMSQDEALKTLAAITKAYVSFITKGSSTKNFRREPGYKPPIYRVRLNKKIRVCLILIGDKLQIFAYDKDKKASRCQDHLR